MNDGVVKTLHLVRVTPEGSALGVQFFYYYRYRMYVVIIEKLHASNMKIFTYPSKFEVFTNLS